MCPSGSLTTGWLGSSSGDGLRVQDVVLGGMQRDLDARVGERAHVSGPVARSVDEVLALDVAHVGLHPADGAVLVSDLFHLRELRLQNEALHCMHIGPHMTSRDPHLAMRHNLDPEVAGQQHQSQTDLERVCQSVPGTQRPPFRSLTLTRGQISWMRSGLTSSQVTSRPTALDFILVKRMLIRLHVNLWL